MVHLLVWPVILTTHHQLHIPAPLVIFHFNVKYQQIIRSKSVFCSHIIYHLKPFSCSLHPLTSCVKIFINDAQVYNI